jgi:hypothetical protein
MTVATITRHATRNVAAAAIDAAGNALKVRPQRQSHPAPRRAQPHVLRRCWKPDQERAAVHADGILSNPLRGKSVADSGDFKVTFDLVIGERVFDGKVDTARVLGVGVVYHAAARLAFEPDGSVVEAGPGDDAGGTQGALCEYLASS